MCFFIAALAILAILYFIKKISTAQFTLKKNLSVAAKCPSPFIWRLGFINIVTVRKPEHMQIVLNSPYCLDKSIFYRFFRVERGLFGSPASVWRHDRKVLGPSVGPTILCKAVHVFNEKMALCAQLMESHIGRERDLTNDIGRCMMDVLSVNAFSVDLDCQRNPDGKEFVDILAEYVHIVTDRAYKPWFHLDFVYRFSKAYRRECQLLEIGYSALDKVLQNYKQRSIPTEDADTKTFIAKLFELYQANANGDIQYLRDHLLTMVLAGSETTMTVASNVILMLAVHQDIQERVYQELVEAIGTDQHEPISQESVANLPYFEMVCKETMRLFPIAPIAGRKASKDIVLDENHTIPTNAMVLTVFYVMYRDPKIWGPNAAEFDPERFQPEIVAQRHPYAFIPFMAGPRMCPGMRYGWLALKILLGHVLRKYHIRTSLTMKDITPEYIFLNRIKQGCPVTLTIR